MSGPGSHAIHPWVIAPVVALAAFMEILDISVANVALPHIAGDLSASQDESTWTLTSYLVTNAAVMPISGWLSGKFGRKRFFLTCIAGFSIASLLCGLAPNLASLVVLRALQGAAGGGLQPTGQAILNDSFPPEKRGVATAIYAVAAVTAPAIGPTLGGWITDNYEWRWVFLINVPVGIILVFLIGFLVQTPNEEASGAKGRVDFGGFVFIALALGCLQIVLDRGQEDDWFSSGMITYLAIASAISFVLFAWWEWPQDNPMVDLKLFKHRDFAVGFILMCFFGFMILGTTYLLPTYTQTLMGYRATESGEVIAPGGLLLIVLFPLMGKLVSKVDSRILIATGVLCSAGALWWMTGFYLEVSFATIAMGRLMQAFGLAFLFLPINALGFRDIPPERTNYASALINLARNFGGSIGISFASTLVTRRSQFHQSRLVEHLQSMNPNLAGLTHQLSQLTHAAGDTLSIMARTYQAATQQAMLMSYLDAYKAFSVIFLMLLPLLLFVKPGVVGGKPHGAD
ncbi:MAG TPA: DHA2 family efflux MFS transporter permease subunit [Steroidobacteraceae bacterium]